MLGPAKDMEVIARDMKETDAVRIIVKGLKTRVDVTIDTVKVDVIIVVMQEMKRDLDDMTVALAEKNLHQGNRLAITMLIKAGMKANVLGDIAGIIIVAVVVVAVEMTDHVSASVSLIN